MKRVALSVVSPAPRACMCVAPIQGERPPQKETNVMKLPATLAGVTAGMLLAGFAVAQTPSTPPQPSTHRAADTTMSGRHTMTGEVTSVAPDKGRALIKTPEGRRLLHFPPSALQNVKKGDRVTVELAQKDNGPAPTK